MQKIRLALIGNPNCGKTTMFNELTGSKQYVGNWPGVTVEKKEGNIRNKNNISIIDLPGIYSLSPYTSEEIITRDYIFNENPDIIINIVDASNIERNLYLTTQIIEMGIPVVIALNMMDIIEKRGDTINIEKLSSEIGCPILEISALKGKGLKEVIQKAEELFNLKKQQNILHRFDDSVEKDLKSIENIIENKIEHSKKRWLAVKLFEKDKKVLENIELSNEENEKIAEIIQKAEKRFDDDSEAIIINERYNFITNIIKEIFIKKDNKNMTLSDKIDRVVTNRYLAFPIFFGVIFLIYFISVTTIGKYFTDWTNEVFFGEYVTNFVTNILEKINTADWLQSLVVDGIVAGVGAVLGFVPQMFILFFFLSILEDCGYMSRIAFIMDRVFRKFGLSGKSFIPMLISSGCGVPGIMASRTIENEKDRRLIIMVTTFVPCSAKIPIIALFSAALFPNNPFMGPSIYFLGIAIIIISGIILKKTKLFSGDTAPFVMELPQYHMPSPRTILMHMWERVRSFIVKAGTIIFISSVVIWFLANFNFTLHMVEQEDSILAIIGKFIAPIFIPLGFGNWQATVATINGVVAKESVVNMFGIILGLGEVDESNLGLIAQISQLFTSVSAYSFVVFNMLCAPCIAAIGSIKREMGNWKWTIIALAYQTLIAYVISFIFNQIGGLIFLNTGINLGVILAGTLILFILYLLFRKNKNI